MLSVRTRFAPSPTGTPESIHLGFVIRALWNYAYAKKYGGQFVLRIEDTDQKRSRKDTEEEILKILKIFGISWDEGPDIGGPYGPYRQSERLKKYQDAAHLLVQKGCAYYDFDAVIREKEVIKAAYSDKRKLEEIKARPKARNAPLDESLERVKAGESYVVRVKIPEDKVFEYNDWILKKKIRFLGKEVPDMILLKSDGYPTYHLAVVVDDIDMKISHVFRGQEWITSTPIHLFLYEAFGAEIPEIGHFSVIIDPRTRKKFSKRDMTGLFGVRTWLSQGYLPEAIINYLMLLGWAPKDNREIFSLNDFIQAFDQDGVQKANPVFNSEKLDWFNGQYIRMLSEKELADKILDFYKDKYPKETVYYLSPLVKSRIRKLVEFEGLAGYVFKRRKPIRITDNFEAHIKSAIDALSEIYDWNKENIDNALLGKIKECGFKTGDFFMDLRGAIAGSRVTPPFNESLVPIGKLETLERLKESLL